MANSESTATLLTEHLRYAPVALLDDIINSINNLSYRGVDNIEASLSNVAPSLLGFKDIPANIDGSLSQSADERAKYEIENGCHQLETLLNDSIDKNFDILEIFALRNMLAVPEELSDWVRLRHYEGLNFDQPADAPTPESIHLQRQKVRESQRLNRLLLSESQKNAALISQLRQLKSTPAASTIKLESTDPKPEKGPLAFLSQTGDLADGSATAPLSTNTEFALSQLPALKQLLADLRPQMQQLSASTKPDPNVVQTEEEKSARRQRLEYIETQTRKHLENVRGLELGKNGEVIDGEWQGGGRSLGRGEVEDLERVVAMVGGREKGDGMDES